MAHRSLERSLEAQQRLRLSGRLVRRRLGVARRARCGLRPWEERGFGRRILPVVVASICGYSKAPRPDSIEPSPGSFPSLRRSEDRAMLAPVRRPRGCDLRLFLLVRRPRFHRRSGDRAMLAPVRGPRDACAGPETARSCAGPEAARSRAGPRTARR